MEPTVKFSRRDFIYLSASAATLAATSRIARAEIYPARPIRLIVGFVPGGPTDIMGRLTAQWLSERLGQSVIVENRPGAASNIGAEVLVRAAPDGYTLFMANISNAVNATLYDKLPFDFVRDVVAVAASSAFRTSWRLIRMCRPEPSPSSLLTPKVMLAKSFGPEPAPACTCLPNCSS